MRNNNLINNYPGGKNAEGVIQTLINLIPPHTTFVESFAGSAVLTRSILSASESFLYEIDPLQSGLLHIFLRDRAVVIDRDFFSSYPLNVSSAADTFIFADPPYLFDTRSSQRCVYYREWSTDDHLFFLDWVLYRPELIMITHPRTTLYSSKLRLWNSLDFSYKIRTGMFHDCIWYNYPTPSILHDYRYVGRNKTERQRIHRKIDRFVLKLSTLPAQERNAIISEINKQYPL